MPSSSTLHSEEKDKIKKAIQSGKASSNLIPRIHSSMASRAQRHFATFFPDFQRLFPCFCGSSDRS
jgi:hypothetical protein